MCLAIKPSSMAVPTIPAMTALRDPPESRRPQLISLDLICGLVSNHPSLTPGAKILEKLPLEMTLRRPMCSRSYLSRRFGGLAVLKEYHGLFLLKKIASLMGVIWKFTLD